MPQLIEHSDGRRDIVPVLSWREAVAIAVPDPVRATGQHEWVKRKLSLAQNCSLYQRVAIQ
jgi:hypothetical protein